MIVENQAGAGGRIAMKAVARGTPDGYTLLLGGTNNNAITPALYKDLDFDAAKDFAPVAAIATDSLVLVVNPGVPAKTLAELVAYAKANPGKLTIGRRRRHLAALPARVRAHQERHQHPVRTVPWRGAGHDRRHLGPDPDARQRQGAAAAADPGRQAARSRGRQRRALARAARRADAARARHADGFPTAVWYGLLAPAGTPAPVIAKLNATVNARLKTAEMKASLAKLSLDARPMSPQEFGTVLVDDMRQWGGARPADRHQAGVTEWIRSRGGRTSRGLSAST